MSHPTDDANTKRSIHQPLVAGKPVTITSAAGNALEIRGDFGVWDNVANKFVLLEQTTIGTTALPKNQ